jgi:hypothetical protein
LACRLGNWLISNTNLTSLQIGFEKDLRTADNIFVIKITMERHLRAKRSHIYWCLADFEKGSNSIDREVVCFEIRWKGESDNMVE